MDENKITSPENNSEEQEIDLIELAKEIWGKRKFLLKICGVAIVIALVVAFSIPKEYTTTATLAPEAQETNKMGNLSGLAAMAGINLNTSVGADAISPTLYPDVVQSNPFMLELLPVNVSDKKAKYAGTLYDYMDEKQKRAWWGYIIQAPFKLLGLITSLGSDKEESEGIDPFALTKEQDDLLKDLKERISIVVDKKTMIITVSVKMQDPLISAQIAEVVIENLQSYITDYRTQKAKQDLVFTEKVFEDAKKAYYETQQTYARFEDANRNIATASYRTEQERLRNEMTLAFNVYNTLAQKLEQDRLRVQEQTPVYTIIQPPTVPIKASSPKKLLILVGFIFLGLFGGIGWIFVKNAFLTKESELES